MLKAGRATRAALHTLQGKLGWCGMTVRGGRAYMAGLRDVVRESKGSKPHRKLAVDESLREDLEWWSEQLKDMTGGGSRLWLEEADHTVLTCKSDASGHLGWGIAVGDELHFSTWTAEEALDPDMVLKEMIPLLYLSETRGEQLEGQVVRMGVDNSGAVFNTLTGKGEGEVRKLMKRMAAMQNKHNFDVLGVHVDRELNKLSDMLTRFLQAEQLDEHLPGKWQVQGASLRASRWRMTPRSRRVWVMKLSA